MAKGKTYTPEFKEQSARRVVETPLPIAQVARELGVNDTTLGFWVKAYKKKLSGQPIRQTHPMTSGSGNLSAATASLRWKLPS